MEITFDEDGFFTRLRSVISKKGLPYDRLAALCDMPKPSFESYVYHHHTPRAPQLAKLCKGLDIDANWLLFGDSRKFNKWRIRRGGFPTVSFVGMEDIASKWIAAYENRLKDETDVALVEVQHDGIWERLAYITGPKTGGCDAG
jgi:hypothetical protein